jgi:hypothetical protein
MATVYGKKPETLFEQSDQNPQDRVEPAMFASERSLSNTLSRQ